MQRSNINFKQTVAKVLKNFTLKTICYKILPKAKLMYTAHILKYHRAPPSPKIQRLSSLIDFGAFHAVLKLKHKMWSFSFLDKITSCGKKSLKTMHLSNFVICKSVHKSVLVKVECTLEVGTPLGRTEETTAVKDRQHIGDPLKSM